VKNIIIIVADSLRRDTFEGILNRIPFPEGVSYQEFKVRAKNSCTELSLPWMLSGMEVFSPNMSIPQDMRKRGYHTVMIHSNPVVHRFHGPFDTVIDLGSTSKVSRKVKRLHRVTRFVPNWLYQILRGGGSGYLPYARVDRKLEEYNELDKTDPFFMWLHLMDPHTPYYPHEYDLNRVVELNRKQISTVRGYYKPSELEGLEWYHAYELEVRGMHRTLNTFFAELDYSKNTVIFTSDHGEEFGEYGEFGHKGNRFNPENVEVPFFILGEGIGTVSIQSHKTLRELIRKLI